MSMLVVQDVTKASAAVSSVSKKNMSSQSAITPFKKVLQTEEQKKAGAVTASSDTEKSSSTSSSSSKDPAVTGKVTLDSIFRRASEKYDISYDFLVAVAKAESDFDTECVSSAGAKGIMQIMPYECEEFGVTDPFDAEQNIMAVSKLLKAHLDKFDGDFILAAAAYNAGSGTVQKYGGVPPYTETQNYVKRIQKYMSEGVTVPDRMVTVGDTDKYTGSGASTGVDDSTDRNSAGSIPVGFDTGKTATDSDLEKVLVELGTGESKVTMTYGAYLRYLELGTTGVG